MKMPNWDAISDNIVHIWQDSFSYFARELEASFQLGEFLLRSHHESKRDETKKMLVAMRQELKRQLMMLDGNPEAQIYFRELGMSCPSRGKPLEVIISFGSERAGNFPVQFVTPEGNLTHLYTPPLKVEKSENLFDIAALRRNQLGIKRFEEMGTQLFKTLFSAEAIELLDKNIRSSQSKDLPLSLCFELDLNGQKSLNSMPWEILYRDGFLSRYFPIIRRIRHTKAQIIAPNPADKSILLAGYCENSDIDLNTELGTLENVFWREKVRILQQYQLRSLKSELSRENFKFLHLISHGETTGGVGYLHTKGQQGELEIGQANDLAKLLVDKQCELVFVNTCFSSRFSTIPLNDPFKSVATALVGNGVPNVIGMNTMVSDQAAIKLAEVFYENVLEGYAPEVALCEARRVLAGSSSSYWDSFNPIFFKSA